MTRIRMIYTWTVALADKSDIWSTQKEFEDYAINGLKIRLQNYNQETTINAAIDNGKYLCLTLWTDISLGKTLDLEFFKDVLSAHFEKAMSHVSPELITEQILEFVTLDDTNSVDHSILFTEANAAGKALAHDDYPVFIPQTDPAWPEANEVFFQDGFWWWMANIPNHSHGPAVGPKPEALFKLYKR